jgi:hypothetical protein
MIRIALALCLAFSAVAQAQLIVRPPPAKPVPVPAGVIAPPMLPLPGSPLQTGAPPQPGVPAQNRLRPFLMTNPFGGLGAYAPYWPAWYDTPPIVTNNIISLSVPAPVPMLPPPPPELRARLTLNVPLGAHVFLAGKEVDAAAIPVILESPVLQESQAYAFDVKVTWIDGRVKEERSRVVIVDAGSSKSLTYTR